MQSKSLAVSVVAVVLLMGCYSLQPIRGTTPPPGTAMGFDINDAGRVALGGSMGPLIDRIEGRLIQRDSNEYVVGVTGVRLLREGEQVWHGEVVRIKTEYVSGTYERRFDKARSAALGAAGVAAIVSIATKSLAGLGSFERPGEQPPDTSSTIRRPRH